MTKAQRPYPLYLPLYIALLVILAASITAVVVLASLTDTLQSSAEIVNTAGFQRTLSQRIALYAVLVSNPDSNLGTLFGEPGLDRAALRLELEDTLSQFEDAHIWLEQRSNTPELKELYFTAPINLDTLSRAYIHSTRLLLRQPDDNRTLATIISSAQEGLLTYLDRAVHLFQDANQQSHLFLAQLQTMLIVLLAAMMIALVLLVFRPMLRRMELEHQTLNDEIERRQQIERDLIATTTLQRAIFDSAHVAIIATDTQGIIQQFNRAAEEWLGYRAEEVIGKATPLIYHDPVLVAERARELSEELGESIQPGFEVFTAKPRLGIPYEEEWVYISYDKARIPVWLTVSARRDPQGNILGYVGMAQNITMIKVAEDALHESLDRYDEVVSNSPGMVYRVRVDGEGHVQFDYVSPRCLELNGLPAEALLRDGSLFEKQIHPDDYDEYLSLSRKAVQEKTPFAWEGRAIVHGETRWRRLESHPKTLDESTVVWDGIEVDTTAQRKAEEALWESQRFVENATAMLPDVLYIYDVNLHQNVYANRSLYTLLGYTERDLRLNGEPAFNTLLHPDDLHNVRAWHESFIHAREKDVLETEYRLKHRDGTWRWIHTRDRVYRRDANGVPCQSIGMAQDITERKRAEKQAFELRMETEHARILADFIQDTSHDLKTPLTVQSTSLHLGQRYLDIALEKFTEQDSAAGMDALEKVRRHMERITHTQRHMSRLISEMLEMVRLDGKYLLEFRPTSLTGLVKEMLVRFETAIAEKKLTLRTDLADDPVTVSLAMPEFGQVLVHLLQNAIQYTSPGGTITLHVKVDEENATLIVEDTGMGIAAEDIPRIFDRFYRADHARNTETGGSGLGLTMVKKLVELHQGSIAVTSEPGKGSRFEVTLPCRISLPA